MPVNPEEAIHDPKERILKLYIDANFESAMRKEAIHDPKERILKLQPPSALGDGEARSNPRSERADIETRLKRVGLWIQAGKQSTIRKSGY